MTEPEHRPARPPGGDEMMPGKIVYGLYAVGYVVFLTTIAGLVYAYLSKGRNAVLDTHLDFQIRTFWISVGLAILGTILSLVGIGFIVLLLLPVWGLVRVVSGFLLLNEGRPVTHTEYLGLLAK